MPVFEFTQKEVTTHTIVVRAASKREAEEYVGSICDDEFADSDTEWKGTKCKRVTDDSFADTDLTQE